VLPPITPYYVMKVGHIPLISYCRPGDPAVAEQVSKLATRVRGVLLERLGPVVWESSVSKAAFALEELGRNCQAVAFVGATRQRHGRSGTARIERHIRRALVAPDLSSNQSHSIRTGGLTARGNFKETTMLRFAANLSMMYNEHAFLRPFCRCRQGLVSPALNFCFPMIFLLRISRHGWMPTA